MHNHYNVTSDIPYVDCLRKNYWSHKYSDVVQIYCSTKNVFILPMLTYHCVVAKSCTVR